MTFGILRDKYLQESSQSRRKHLFVNHFSKLIANAREFFSSNFTFFSAVCLRYSQGLRVCKKYSKVFIVSLRRMPSLVVVEQPNDSNISTADKLSRVLRARRDMEADPRHPDALVQREKDEINCARRRIHSDLTTLKSIKSTAHAQKSALLWIIKEHGWGGGYQFLLSMGRWSLRTPVRS